MLWLWPEPGAAQTTVPNTALIVRVPGDERIYVPLRAELGSYRFRVLELADRPGRSSETLAELATARDAQAALRARPDGMAVELWVQGTGTDRDVGSEEVVSAGPSRNPDLLALRVTEAMRARGLHLPPPSAAAPARATAPVSTSSTGAAAAVPVSPTAPRPGAEPARPTPESGAPKPSDTSAAPKTPESIAAAPAASKPAPPAATGKPEAVASPKPTPQPASKPTAPSSTSKPSPLATPKPAAGEPKAQPAAKQAPAAVRSNAPPLPPRKPLLFAEAAPLGVLSAGANTLGPAIDALVQLRLQPYPSSSISLFGFIPIWQAPLERDEGSVEVSAWAIGGFADFHVPLRNVEISAGLGAGGMLISVRARAWRAPAMDGESPQRLPVFLGRVGVSLALTRDLRLTARVMAGLLAPILRVQVGDETTTWGRPLVLGSLGLEVALPWER